LLGVNKSATTSPNVIFMFADDIGFNDLGYGGCTATSTPFIDELATTESIILWHNYAYKMCSPSRSALMTGRYPSKLGLQNGVFNIEFPVSLTRQVSTISDEFQAAGYSTHCIGKWHLGMQSWEYTPTYRGFDTFAGFWGGWSSYYNHTMYVSEMKGDNRTISYKDLRLDEEEVTDADGMYGVWWERDRTIDLLAKLKQSDDPFFIYLAWQASHDPNEAPDEYLEKYENIKVGGVPVSGPIRQFAMAQTETLDMAVHDVVSYLKDNGMWDDTLLVFNSDNGGDYLRGDNYPLRGFKNSAWEGGIRVPGFVSGGFLNPQRRGEVLEGALIHIIDWYPTLLAAANIQVGHHRSTKLHEDSDKSPFETTTKFTVPLDGKNLWNAINYGDIDDDVSVQNRELVLDLNGEGCPFSSCGALRVGPWKYLRGSNIILLSEQILDHGGDSNWQSDFSICHGSDNALGCDGTTEHLQELSTEDINCYLRESGCLFHLGDDPCEFEDVGDEYPQIRKEMVQRMDEILGVSVTALINDNISLDVSVYDPAYVCDADFWCPFMAFSDVPFEETLTVDYFRLYGEGDTDTDTEFVDGVGSGAGAGADSEIAPETVSDEMTNWNVLGLSGSGGAQNQWRIAFVFCLLITTSIICIFRVNGMHSGIGEKETARNTRRETTPLIEGTF